LLSKALKQLKKKKRLAAIDKLESRETRKALARNGIEIGEIDVSELMSILDSNRVD